MTSFREGGSRRAQSSRAPSPPETVSIQPAPKASADTAERNHPDFGRRPAVSVAEPVACDTYRRRPGGLGKSCRRPQ